MKISRNALCPCGSGKKYKYCCLGKPVPGEEGSVEAQTEATREQWKWVGYCAVSGLLVSIAAGFWRDAYTGLVVAAAWTLASVAFLIFRNPPPPNDNPGNPAGLDFGRRD